MQKLMAITRRAILATTWVALAAGATLASAGQWELDNENSRVEFISIKNTAVAETHSFKQLSGSIDADGKIHLEIALDSVETLIPIRNERMREMLFNTGHFPVASIESWVDQNTVKALSEGDVVVADVPITLTLHGQERPMTVPVVLVGTSSGAILVVTSRPVIINAGDFGLTKGIGLLQDIAGLNAIATAVPVTFHLLFAPLETPLIDS